MAHGGNQSLRPAHPVKHEVAPQERATMSDSLQNSFTDVLGKQPTEAARQRLHRMKKALRLKDDDAMWTILIALESYQELYEEMPDRITAKADELLSSLKTASAAIAAASMAEQQKKLSAAIAEATLKTAEEVGARQSSVAKKEASQWIIAATAMSVFCATVLSILMYRWGDTNGYIAGKAAGYVAARTAEGEAGFKKGRVAGYEEAKAEKAAAAWANTNEGKLAQALSKAGASMTQFARCTGKGWRIEKGHCYGSAAEDGHYYGWPLPKSIVDAENPR